jgi:hypothetical protein
MRANDALIGGERRRRTGAAFPLFLSRGGVERGGEGKQDKGSVSRPCISLCLHILIPRDAMLSLRDMICGNGGNPPVSSRNREKGRRHHV